MPACHDAIGRLCALYEPTIASPKGLHFHIAPDTKGFLLSCNSDELWRGTDAGEIAAAFEFHLYARMAMALENRMLSLHAAAVALSGRAILFAGASGAGKSSLATKALLEGLDYLSDEFALLDETGQVHPFPRPLQWGKTRHPAFLHKQMLASGLFRKAGYSFPDRHGQTIRSLLWLPQRVIRQPQTVHALILPHFCSKHPSAEIRPVRRSQALMELAPEIHQRPAAADGIRLLHGNLPPDLPVFRLRYGDMDAAWQVLKQENLIPRA